MKRKLLTSQALTMTVLLRASGLGPGCQAADAGQPKQQLGAPIEPEEDSMPHEEWIKTIVGFATSTLGFLVALLVNSYVELRRDKKAYCTMLKAIKAEAGNNKVILNDSFLRLYRDGVVIREFFLGAAAQCLASPLFIRHVKSSEIGVLNAYLRNITLANGYREKAERFRLDPKGKASQEWFGPLINCWDDNLKQCQDSIDQVLELGESSCH
jgi:hypothetical protein